MSETKKPLGTRIVSWFKETKSDMKKIIWPTPKSVMQNTVIVIIAVLISAAAISGLDVGLTALLKLIIGA